MVTVALFVCLVCIVGLAGAGLGNLIVIERLSQRLERCERALHALSQRVYAMEDHFIVEVLEDEYTGEQRNRYNGRAIH